MPFRSVYRHMVGWGDCDPAEIVFYPNYFRWFDNATFHLFKAAGLDWNELFARHDMIGLPLVDVGARFIAPSRFGDELTIESEVTEWHSKLLVVGHTVRNSGQLAVEGFEKRVWAGHHPDDARRLQAHVIPDEVRRALS